MGMARAKPLEEILAERPDIREEVEDFANYLRLQRLPKKKKTPQFDWMGALKGIDEPLTSVELQHAVSRWRTKEP